MRLYEIVRYYHPAANRDNEIIKRDLNLQEAQAHCSNPSTKNDTHEVPDACKYFDGYRIQRY